MPSRKKQEDEPWWFSPTIFDVVFKDEVYQKYKPTVTQQIVRAFADKQFPTRPRRAKSDWIEPVTAEGATYQLTCHVNENNRKIVIKNIRPPKKMMRPRRHK